MRTLVNGAGRSAIPGGQGVVGSNPAVPTDEGPGQTGCPIFWPFAMFRLGVSPGVLPQAQGVGSAGDRIPGGVVGQVTIETHRRGAQVQAGHPPVGVGVIGDGAGPLVPTLPRTTPSTCFPNAFGTLPPASRLSLGAGSRHNRAPSVGRPGSSQQMGLSGETQKRPPSRPARTSTTHLAASTFTAGCCTASQPET
jgi:hypothetical protein